MGPTLSRRPVCTGSRGRLPPLCPAWLAALLLAIVPFLAGRASAGSRLPAEPGPSTSRGATPAVALQPLGDVDPALVRAVADAVRQTFAVRDTVLAEKPLPQAAFYRARRRYRGEQVLRRLEAETPARFDKVLGLMSCDLSVTKGRVYDWGVMGVAGLAQRAGVVSVHRLRRRHAPPSLVARRMRQVVVHELGHTFGLPHCPSPHCIMNDAEGGIAAVDASSGRFCGRCRRKLAGLLRDQH